LAFPVAAALVHGRVGAQEVTGAALHDQDVLALAEKVTLYEDRLLSARFPAERLCRVVIELGTGQRYDSGIVAAPWGHDHPPSDDELHSKFCGLAEGYLESPRLERLAALLWDCANLAQAAELETGLSAPGTPSK
jgi:2-methylcitrate dehydratase PrpD